MSDDTRISLATATSYGLSGTRLRPPGEALARPEWNRLAGLVGRERQWGPLAWAIADGWWPGTEPQRAQALARHRTAMAGALRIEERLLDLHERCAARGIRIVVLKGPAVAHLDHDEPSLRSFADLDLLVAASDLAGIEELLGALGGVRRHREPRPGFDERFSKGLSVRLPDGVEIDVHRTLTLGPFGLRIRPDQLLARTETFELGGLDIEALDGPGRFLHACVHAALGAATPAMTPRRDIVAIAEHATDPGPVCAAVDLAEAWGLGLVVAWAVHDAAATFDWLPTSAMRARIDAVEPSAREWRWLAGYHRQRSSARHALDSLGALDRWSDRARYALAALVPRGRGSLGRVRRAADELARR